MPERPAPLARLTSPPVRLTDEVRHRLRSAVLTGALVPGQQLSVPALAEQLGVSRGSVREAVLHLVSDGLAEERPRRGVVVTTLGTTEVGHIHQVREVLEGQAARLCVEAAGGAPAALLADLRDALADQARAVAADDAEGYGEADARFHARIADACGNPVLQALVERLHAQMTVALARVTETAEHRLAGHDELRAVLDAVAAGDGDAAESAMRAHIRRTRSALATTPGRRS